MIVSVCLPVAATKCVAVATPLLRKATSYAAGYDRSRSTKKITQLYDLSKMSCLNDVGIS